MTSPSDRAVLVRGRRCEREDCKARVRRIKAPPAYPRFHPVYSYVCLMGHRQKET